MVHNHGPSDGPGFNCNEIRQPDGSKRGVCLLTADELAGKIPEPAPEAELPVAAAPVPRQPARSPEQVARDVIHDYIGGGSPHIRLTAERTASAFNGEVDAAYLVGAALKLGALSFESILKLMTLSIEAVTPDIDVAAAWAEHSIGFSWDNENHRYGEERAFLAGFEAGRPA